MKVIGYVRQVDKLGRLVLPSDIRKALNITDGEDSVEFLVQGNTITLRKYRPVCVFCGSGENNLTYKGQPVCLNCLDELRTGSAKPASPE